MGIVDGDNLDVTGARYVLAKFMECRAGEEKVSRGERTHASPPVAATRSTMAFAS